MHSDSQELVHLSEAEVYRACQRAFFALGFPAGFDEDAGIGVAWLSSLNLGGLEHLSRAIPSLRKHPYYHISKAYDEAGKLLIDSHADSGFFSSVEAIDLLCTEASDINLPYCESRIENFSYPQLLIAVAVNRSILGYCFAISFDSIQIIVGKQHILSNYSIDDLGQVFENIDVEIRCSFGEFESFQYDACKDYLTELQTESYKKDVMKYRICVDAKVWHAIKLVAAESFVPATEVSRTTGAGAQIDDNE